MSLVSANTVSLLAMVLVGRLLKFIEARYLVLSGLIMAAYTLSLMVDFTDQTSSVTRTRNFDRNCSTSVRATSITGSFAGCSGMSAGIVRSVPALTQGPAQRHA